MAEEKCNGGFFMQYLILDILERFENGKVDPMHFKWIATGGDVVQAETCQVII